MSDEPKPDLARNIFVVTLQITGGGSTVIARTDMIFIDDEPYAVLEWEGASESPRPALKLKLDPTHLRKMQGSPGYYVYSSPVRDPRTRH